MMKPYYKRKIAERELKTTINTPAIDEVLKPPTISARNLSVNMTKDVKN